LPQSGREFKGWGGEKEDYKHAVFTGNQAEKNHTYWEALVSSCHQK